MKNKLATTTVSPPLAPQGFWDSKRPWTIVDVLIVLVGGIILSSILVSIIIALIVVISTGGHPNANTLNSFNLTPLEYVIVTLAFYGGVVFTIYLVTHFRHHINFSALGFRMPERKWFLFVPLILVGVVALSFGLQILTSLVFHSTDQTQCEAIKGTFSNNLIYAFLATAVIPPLAEETIFRGFIFGWLNKRVPLAAGVVISAVIFAAAHGSVLLFIPTLGIGVVLALTYYYSKSIFPGMLVHGLYNGLALVFLLQASGCS